jgi:hypothetical protein
LSDLFGLALSEISLTATFRAKAFIPMKTFQSHAFRLPNPLWWMHLILLLLAAHPLGSTRLAASDTAPQSFRLLALACRAMPERFALFEKHPAEAVYDPSAKPGPAVTVSISTTADGHYRITALRTHPGTYVVFAQSLAPSGGHDILVFLQSPGLQTWDQLRTCLDFAVPRASSKVIMEKHFLDEEGKLNQHELYEDLHDEFWRPFLTKSK